MAQFWYDRASDTGRDLILKVENVVERAVEAVGPDVSAGRCIDHYPTNAHERAGKAAGLRADKVEALLSGQSASFSDMHEQAVYEMATCLSNSRWVSKGLFDRAVVALGHESITSVICLMGFYTSVSMTLAFYDVPAGATGMLSMRTRRDTRYRGSISLPWVFIQSSCVAPRPAGPASAVAG